MVSEQVDRLIRKALRSKCRFKVAAIGLGKKGDVRGYAFNSPFCAGKGRGIHAEMNLLRKYRGINHIILCRVGASGNLLPIDPCPNCAKVCAKQGITIQSIR